MRAKIKNPEQWPVFAGLFFVVIAIRENNAMVSIGDNFWVIPEKDLTFILFQ